MVLNRFNKKYFNQVFAKVLLPLLFGFIGGVFGMFIFTKLQETPNQRIKNFYQDEMATVVSPAEVKKKTDENDTGFILVDLRSANEYNTEHFINAVNVPAVSMNTDQLVSAFKALPKDKEIIVHCYSAYCTLGRQVGETLAQHGLFVKELAVGWSELKYHWDLWNPGAKVTDGEKYIIKGAKASPTPDAINVSPCVQGQFGC